MSEYLAHVRWQRKTPDFAYDTYDRGHSVAFGGGTEIKASAAPEFKGNAALPNPEELLVASLSSCHMLTFLALAARKRLVVDAYEDDAVGVMTKNERGKLFVSSVVLRPKVRFAESLDAETIKQMHEKAHAECFIANSVLSDVRVEP